MKPRPDARRPPRGRALVLRLGLTAGLTLHLSAPTGSGFELDAPVGRWTVGGYGEFYAIMRTDADTPRQRPAGLFRLNASGDLHAAARIFVDSRVMFGGWTENGSGFGIHNISDTFQNDSPAVDVEEGYLDLFLGPVDLRIGKQKFAWGKLDSFQPTDVLNPRWYNDPFLTEEQDAKIGVPALQASYFFPSLPGGFAPGVSLTAIWVPIPLSTRFPLREERWFPPTTDVADVVELDPLAILPTNPIQVRNALDTMNRRPAHQLDEGAVGLRVGGLSGPLDWALYFYDGQETAPTFDFLPTVVWPEARRAARAGLPPPLPAPGEPIELRSVSDLVPRFARMRLWGGDAAAEVGGFTVRAETAYGVDRLLPRSVQELVSDASIASAAGPPARQERLAAKLLAGKRVPLDLGDLFAVSDAIEWGVGVDYLYRGWMPLLQITQTVVLDDTPKLLVSEVDTQLLFVLRKSFLAERLGTEFSIVEGLARGYTTGITRFTYEVTDHLRVLLGYLLIAGSRQTLLGQFHDNDQGFAQVRYSF
jgi:hypothetical protein